MYIQYKHHTHNTQSHLKLYIWCIRNSLVLYILGGRETVTTTSYTLDITVRFVCVYDFAKHDSTLPSSHNTSLINIIIPTFRIPLPAHTHTLTRTAKFICSRNTDPDPSQLSLHTHFPIWQRQNYDGKVATQATTANYLRYAKKIFILEESYIMECDELRSSVLVGRICGRRCGW